ncbi:tetratricopeptide repeat protein [Puniceicoccaceae bacterium K14]|nr:tetratricopeptide repeat protein [Puniceicoccaceae bacterium K14]
MHYLIRLTLLLFLAPIASLSAANITWSETDGYQSDEIELSGLLPEEIGQVLNLMNSGRKLEEKKRYKKALKRFKKVTKKYPKSQYAPEAYNRIAQISLKRNKLDDAFEAFQSIAWVYPNYGSFNDTIGEMYKIAMARLTTYRVKIFGVIPGFLNKDRAIKYFEQIVYIAPYGDYAPLSLMNVANTWDKMGNDQMAIYALNRLVVNYPNSLLTPDAYLKLAESYSDQVNGPHYDQRANEEAMTYFQDFLYQYPEDNQVARAEVGLEEAENVLAMSKMKIADFYYFKRNRYEAAQILYNEAITIAPRSQSADIARSRLSELDEKIASVEAKKEEISEEEANEAMQKKAEKRAKRKILGIF